MGYVLIGLAVVVLSALAFPGSPHGRVLRTLYNMARGRAKDYEARHAIDNYRAAVDKAGSHLGRDVETAGGNYEALCGQAERQLHQIEQEIAVVTGRLGVLRSEGTSADDPRAVRNAEKLFDLRERRERVASKLQRYKASRAAITGRLTATAAQVREGREKLLELEAELQESEMERQAAQSITVGGDVPSLADAEATVRGRIDQNRGAARMATEVYGDDAGDAALDQKAKSDQVRAMLAKEWNAA